MASSKHPNPTRDGRLNELIAEYLRRVDHGERVDPKQLVAAHPDLADSFHEYLQDAALMDQVQASPEPASPPKMPAADTAESRAAEETIPPSHLGHARKGSTQPRQFGRYRILRQLGQGAMGSVYLAEDPQLERQVALKIPKLRDEEPDSLARFYREARVAATLRHPNICPVYDIGEQDGTPFIAMAHLEGAPLSRLIGTSQFRSDRNIALLVRKVALALAEAHSKGVVHRDLKPGNIMVDRKQEPVVMDFGLAHRRGKPGEEKLTHSGLVLGTPAYMSPEQAASDFERVGPRSDIYSLGVILFELLTGQLPFQGSVGAVLGQIVAGRAVRPSEVCDGVDLRLEAICVKMMARESEERFASAAEVVGALTKFVQEAAGGGKSSAQAAAGSAERAAQGVPREVADRVATIVERAIELLASQEYEQAAELLKRIPESHRSPEATRLLNKAVKLEAERESLNARMLQAIQNRQYEGLKDVLERLLDIQPGNLTARDLHGKLSTYGPKQAYRFDKQGNLLSAKRTPLWVLLGKSLRQTLRGVFQSEAIQDRGVAAPAGTSRCFSFRCADSAEAPRRGRVLPAVVDDCDFRSRRQAERAGSA